MVNRIRDYTNPPVDFIDSKWDATRAQAIADGGTHKAKKACYRDTTKDFLIPLYDSKCAYCERSRGYEIQVDHYRPTKTRNNNTGAEYNHPGYYWLAYVWSNLIPLCSACNRAKSNKFPLVGWTDVNRIVSHIASAPITIANISDLAWLNDHEKPLIIHPEIESIPERHFKFLNNGKVIGRTDEGKETIKVLQLDRDDLIRLRLKVLSKIVDEINRSMNDYLDDHNESRLKGALNMVYTNIVDGGRIDHVFSMFYIYIYKYFNYYIGSHLPSSVITIKAQDYFEEFKLNKNFL